jgi:hypothetical protein
MNKNSAACKVVIDELMKYLTPDSKRAMESEHYSNILRALRRIPHHSIQRSPLAQSILKTFKSICSHGGDEFDIKFFSDFCVIPMCELFADIDMCESTCAWGREYSIPDYILKITTEDNFYFFIDDQLIKTPVSKWRDSATKVINKHYNGKGSKTQMGAYKWKGKPNIDVIERRIRKYNTTDPVNTYNTIIARQYVLKDLGVRYKRSHTSTKKAISKEEMSKAASYSKLIKKAFKIPLFLESRLAQILLSSYISVYDALSNGIIYLRDSKSGNKYKVDLKELDTPESIRKRVVLSVYQYLNSCFDKAYGKHKRHDQIGTSSLLNKITSEIFDELFHLSPNQIKKIVSR